MTSASVPYDWLKTLPPELLTLDDMPLFGNCPSFPWQQFSGLFAKYFDIESWNITPGEVRWRTQEELFEGLGEALHPIQLSVSALEGGLCWLMAEKDIALVMSALLSKNLEPTLQVIDKELQEAFYQFAAIEAIHVFSQVEFDKTLTPHILDDTTMPVGPALCLDIQISFYEHSVWGRLVISPEFRKSWKEHYSERKLATALSQTLAQKLQLTLGLEAGKVNLAFDEWKGVTPGDFIILDQCSLEPGEEKGRVWMTLNGKPLFRARVKPGSIKILESPLYHEVLTAMEKQSPEDNAQDNQEHMEGEAPEDEDLDFDDESEEEAEGSAPPEEEEFSGELDTEEEMEEFETAKPSPAPAPVAEAQAKPPFSSQDINVALVIEVGRLQISVQKLLELQPGNLLELDVKPESGVDLVINGKCIGKGELIRVGEALGVRVLDLG